MVQNGLDELEKSLETEKAKSKKGVLDFPGGPVVKNPPANADLTWHRATKPVHHNYWNPVEAHALEPMLHKRSHRNDKSGHHNWRVYPAHCN